MICNSRFYVRQYISYQEQYTPKAYLESFVLRARTGPRRLAAAQATAFLCRRHYVRGDNASSPLGLARSSTMFGWDTAAWSVVLDRASKAFGGLVPGVMSTFVGSSPNNQLQVLVAKGILSDDHRQLNQPQVHAVVDPRADARKHIILAKGAQPDPWPSEHRPPDPLQVPVVADIQNAASKQMTSGLSPGSWLSALRCTGDLLLRSVSRSSTTQHMTSGSSPGFWPSQL